ncbi:hypothetical protein SAI_1725 [Streptococcus agalactiae H36B]|nr:hypothetical protein SAI_1725 [Streptococcus agalactiae H36B]
MIWKMDQISNSLFSIGVPDNAKQFLTSKDLKLWAILV